MSVTHKSPNKRIMDDTILYILFKTTQPRIHDNALKALQAMDKSIPNGCKQKLPKDHELDANMITKKHKVWWNSPKLEC